MGLRQPSAKQSRQGLLPFDFDENDDCDEVTGRAGLPLLLETMMALRVGQSVKQHRRSTKTWTRRRSSTPRSISSLDSGPSRRRPCSRSNEGRQICRSAGRDCAPPGRPKRASRPAERTPRPAYVLGQPVDGVQLISSVGASRMSGHGDDHDHPSLPFQASSFALEHGLRLGAPRLRFACHGITGLPSPYPPWPVQLIYNPRPCSPSPFSPSPSS
jgi:hypothetical protein